MRSLLCGVWFVGFFICFVLIGVFWYLGFVGGSCVCGFVRRVVECVCFDGCGLSCVGLFQIAYGLWDC